MTESVPKKPNIAEISPHLICALCGGYLIDATTIVECLHSFCKTCIVRYLESSKYCPICEVLVHKTRPLQNIRLDQTLQNIVYKLVPGLFQSEMKRRREFYKDSPTVRSAKTRQEQQRDRIIYSADEQFSIALDYCHDGRVRKPSVGRRSRRQSKPQGPERRYFLCPAATTVALLKKFIKLKFALPQQFKVELFHADGPLRDHYSLMDVAYIYSWKREGVLQLNYTIFKLPEPTPAITLTEIKEETTSELADDSSQKADDNRPSSLFSKASLLGKHRMDENLHHDLSPLELIATVANDISCLQEGRGLKRKTDAAQLYENDDENSSSETQIKRTVERAIDLCQTTSASTSYQDNRLGIISKPYCHSDHRPIKSHSPSLLTTTERTRSPRADNQTDFNKNHIVTLPGNTQQLLPNNSIQSLPSNVHQTQTTSRESVITKVETKDKPKKTDTAIQCESRPKKHKADNSTRPQSHSKSVNKTEATKANGKVAKDIPANSEKKSEKVTEKKSEKLDKLSDKKNDKTCDKKLENAPENKQERVSEKKLEKLTEKKLEKVPERKIEKVPEKKEKVPEKKLEKVPEKKEKVPEKKPEKVPEKKPEKLPEKKPERVIEKKVEKAQEKRNEKAQEKMNEKPSACAETAMVKQDKPVSNTGANKNCESIVKPESTNSNEIEKKTEKMQEKNGDVKGQVEIKLEPTFDKSNVSKATSSPLKLKEGLKVTSQINGHSSPSEIANKNR